MKFLDKPSRYLLFTGKGGVGKTSLSCATALSLAESGKKVLLVSTDPASNLDEVLGMELSNEAQQVKSVPTLYALNIDPEEAARQYREKIVAPYRGILPEASIRSIEEQLSGGCTVEIAAFDEFSKLIGDPSLTSKFGHIILDTAPTGHTLRLLELPSAWSGYIETSTGSTSCLGPLSGLKEQHALYTATVKKLADKDMTTIVLVSRPEDSALREAARTRNELITLGIANHFLAINGVFEKRVENDPIANAFEKRCLSALEQIPEELSSIPSGKISLLPFGLSGIDSLRAMLCEKSPIDTSFDAPRYKEPIHFTDNSLVSFVEEIESDGKGVIMTMGKGGVGKTSVASAIALNLASKGHKVHLSTTDPAAHLDLSLGESVENLTVGCIDAQKEVKDYAEEVMNTAGQDLDEAGKKLLEEDLRSPCTEEIAVFRAFAREVDKGNDGFVVLDTAPTGHTLLLLDAAESYHREVTRTMSDLPQSVKNLLPRLRDPNFSRVFIVTLPEATPVHEAARLQKDLQRAEITPFAWVVNSSLSPLTVSDPVLAAKKSEEARYINEINENYCSKFAVVPWIEYNDNLAQWLCSIIANSNECRELKR
ncbi:arsenical pump-driving ATPase [Chitinispirillales bacterium ANBcel5]|uniref:arsenical pump-driving ATPase n=1 Tax=Cellulosispirillum alkaliphilum TaxID=3039283 RepID=UPI002A57B58D|nr:arsenical pump-driving ATPase [Chitinispirillales bacterium ANBcel5]